MRILVVYDSVFGNTEKVARAIAEALGAKEPADLLHVSKATPDRLAQTDLLVVGSPTRGFRPTEGMQALLKAVPSQALRGIRVAAFDTRLKADELDSAGLRFLVKTGGYAAKRIASRLEKAGGTLTAKPEGFYVEDTEGPMKAGELDRARTWAAGLLAAS
jgi:flavodoxin